MQSIPAADQPRAMWRMIWSSGALLLCCSMHAQRDSVAMRYASTITEVDLRRHLEVIASDAYEGRETGMKGQKLAAEYIMKQFAACGIPPVPSADQKGMMNGYEQSFPLVLSVPGGISIMTAGKTYGFMSDYLYFAEKLHEPLRAGRVTFLGDGKHVPEQARCQEVALMLMPTGTMSSNGAAPSGAFHGELQWRTALAAAHGARVLLIASDEEPAMTKAFAHYINVARMRLAGTAPKNEEKPELQTVVISKAMAEDMLKQAGWNWQKALRRSEKAPTDLKCLVEISYAPRQQELTGENVLGYIEGTDKKEELVLVTAHYDHIGIEKGEVYNGADDDGSGTVAVLELAEAFAKAKANGFGARRSMLFMTVSGEEKGLLGSEWYSWHPVFPLDRTVVDLNIDMIGRVDTAHEKSAPYVYVIGSRMLSHELGDLNERENGLYVGLDLDYRFDAPNDPNRFYYRSDHYNFAKHGIPVIFYFNGVHADYHGPKDEVDRIRFDLLRQRALLVFHAAWELAYREESIIPDVPRQEH